jgi:ribosome maturation factor RimP
VRLYWSSLSTAVQPKGGLGPLFFWPEAVTQEESTKLQPELEQIRARIGSAEPDIELLAVEDAGRGSLRLLIDRPDGVDLETCQRVSDLLGELREEYSLEVSSPGPRRPLNEPGHFERFEGRTAKVRTSEKIDGQRNFKGTIVGSDGESVTLAMEDEVVSIPFAGIERAHLEPNPKNSTGSS